MLENEKATRPKERILTVNNLIKLDPQNPIPIQYAGDSFAIVRGKKYIPFLGRDNNLPNLLLEARLTSPTQDACISSISSSVIGNGLSVLEIEEDKIEPSFLEWMKCVNNDQDSFDDLLLGTIDGEREQGNQFIEVVKGGVGTKAFLKLYLHPFQYCRFAELEKDQRVPSHVIISKMFAKRGHRIKIDDAQKVPLWSPNKLDQATCWAKDENGNLRTMLHFKNEKKGIDYYGMPASISGLRYQVIEGKSAQYNIDNLENNMILGGMLMFKSAMTEAEALVNAEKIMLSHIGMGKTGRIAVISSESGLDDVRFEKYDTKNDGSYIELDKRIEKKLIACNNWHEVLIGLNEGSGSLGNGNNYIRSIWYSKEASLLNPLRRKLTDKIVSPLIKIYAEVFNKAELLKYKFWFNSAMPFSFLGDVKPEQYVKVNEAREAAGLPQDDTMKDKYLSEMNVRTTNRTQDEGIAPSA